MFVYHKIHTFPIVLFFLELSLYLVLYFLPNSFCSKRFHLILMPSRHPNVLRLLQQWQECFAFISIFCKTGFDNMGNGQTMREWRESEEITDSIYGICRECRKNLNVCLSVTGFSSKDFF